MRVTSCPLGAAMITAVALLSCEKKRNFYAFQQSQQEPPDAAAQSLVANHGGGNCQAPSTLLVVAVDESHVLPFGSCNDDSCGIALLK